jgi:hypothetical protein
VVNAFVAAACVKNGDGSSITKQCCNRSGKASTTATIHAMVRIFPNALAICREVEYLRNLPDVFANIGPTFSEVYYFGPLSGTLPSCVITNLIKQAAFFFNHKLYKWI